MSPRACCWHVDSFDSVMPLREQGLPAGLGHAHCHLAGRCVELWAPLVSPCPRQFFVLAKHRKFDRSVTCRLLARLGVAGARSNRAPSCRCAVARYPARGPHRARPGTRAHGAAHPRAVCALCRTVLATSFEYDNDLGLYSCVLGFEMHTAICVSRCATAAERSEVDRCGHVDIHCVCAEKVRVLRRVLYEVVHCDHVFGVCFALQ